MTCSPGVAAEYEIALRHWTASRQGRIRRRRLRACLSTLETPRAQCFVTDRKPAGASCRPS